jgi:hypothetical protein
MDTQDSSNFGAKKSPASRARAAAVAGIVVVASITGVTVSAQIYGLKGINGQLQVEPTGNWLPVGLNATFAHAMLYRNSHLRSIANHVIETGTSSALKQYAQALVRKVDDWDARIIERLKANGVESSYADNELNKSYQGVEDLAKSLATLTGAELDAKFKAQMISLAKQTAPRFKNDISLLDDKDLEGIAAEISGSNNSVSQEINAG